MDDLEAQMKMLEGLGDMNLNNDMAAPLTTPVAPVVEPAQVASAPFDGGVVMNQPVAPVQEVAQQQANNFAAAQVVQPTTTVPTHTMSNAAPVSAPVAPAPVQDFSIFDKDESPVFVKLGEDTSSDRLPFINLKAGESTRIMLFTLTMLPVFTHYIDGLGYIRCKSIRDNGFITDKCPCCEFTNDKGEPIYAKERRILPVIEYPVSSDGKSILSGKQPQLKFIVLSKRDRETLENILADQEKIQTILGFDFLVTIKDGDTFKTKLFSSTFDTIRNQFPNIQQEVAKYSNELLIQACNERFRNVPVESIQRVLDKERSERLAAQEMAARQAPSAASLGLM